MDNHNNWYITAGTIRTEPAIVDNVEDNSASEDEDANTANVAESRAPSEMDRTSTPGRQRSYDPNLPTLHSYLGTELEVVRGRTVLDEGAEVVLDLLQPADVLLTPGQTLPLTVYDQPTINMLRKCIRNDRTFGVLASWTDVHNNITVNNIGTTAEIYEYLQPGGPTSGFRVKAKARQRFKVLDTEPGRRKARVRVLPEVWLAPARDEMRLQSLSHRMRRRKARVRVLPEVSLPPALDEVRLQSLSRHRSPANRQRFRRMDAALTWWPAFVYDQYDIKRLAEAVKKELSSTLLQGQKEAAPVSVHLPEEPAELSWWVAQHAPLRDKHRLLLLKLNSPIQRLRFQLCALSLCRQLLYCQYCGSEVGSIADIFSMSTEGPQGTFVNPGGYLHETITLHQVWNIITTHPPSTEFSWFPGYAWSICQCSHCVQHMGWKFTATNDTLRPAQFWALGRRSITAKMADEGHSKQIKDDQHLLFF